MTIKKLTIEYNAINEHNTFSKGDTLTGLIIVEVSKTTTINSLIIKAKGRADVVWTETHGESQVTYWDKEKYFSHTQSVLQNEHQVGSLTLGSGKHEFPFIIPLPSNDMPSSFKGECGKIQYLLTAQLSRSLRMTTKAKTKFTFISHAESLNPAIMSPQHGAKDRNVVFFASGNISMNIFLEKTGYQQGEDLVVRGEIVNSSTKKIVPKFIIYQKQSFFAGGNRTVHTSNIVKEKESPISSSTMQNMSRVLTVPWGVAPSIHNCRILKVEYRLKVILDVSFTKNPEVKLPLIILPTSNGTKAKQLEAQQQEKPNWFH